MPTFRVDVQPEMLIWAREFMGLSREQAASALGKTALDLRYWEEGALEGPTLIQLREMAALYDVPLAAFYLPHPPSLGTEKVIDYRQLPSSGNAEWSVELRKEFRRVTKQREVAIELARLADEEPFAPSLALSLDESPDAAGKRVRDWLGIPLAEQLNWKSAYAALNAWIAAIEARDILVAQFSDVELREMRGLSITEVPFPIIALNGSDTANGRIFTLLHELIHVLVSANGLCDLSEPRKKRNVQNVEKFCNEVAAATLLPRYDLLEEAREMGVTGVYSWSDSTLDGISRRYKVSREALLRRYVTLGLASLDYYRAKHRQYLKWYEEKREEEREKRRDSDKGGFSAYYKTKLRDLGRRYTADVIQAYRRRDISTADLVNFLGVKVERVGRLVELLQPES